MKVLCPLCRSPLIFEPGTTAERISCTSCESSFSTERIRQAIKKISQSQLQSNNDTAEKPVTDSTTTAKESGSNSRAKQPSVPELNPARKNTPVLNKVVIDERETISVANTTPKLTPDPSSITKRKRRQSTTRILTMIGLALASIVLLGVLIHIVRTPSNAPFPDQLLTDATDRLADDPDGIDDASSESNRLPSIDEEPEPVVTERIPFAALDEPETTAAKPAIRIKSTGQLNKCWEKNRSYLVELQADTPAGPKFATGTIIDSRGWVVTSYQAMAGATKIHVRKAVELPTRLADRVKDQVRGIVAEQPEHDLIILAINRQFVDTFEDVAIEPNDNFVVGRYVIQCQPPTAAFPYHANEARIANRASRQDLESAHSERMSKLGIDANINWIIHEQLSPLRAGAILLDDNGKLVAMNTSASASYDKLAFAIPASYLEKLRAKSDDAQLQPLATPASKATAARQDDDPFSDEVDEPADSAPVAVANTNQLSIKELVETVNRTGTECELFGWWPKTEPQIDLFRQFLRALIGIANRADELDDDGQLLGEWKKKMEVGLGVEASRGQEAQIAFNRQFAGLTVNRNVFAGFAFVKHPATESPLVAVGRDAEVSETIVFEIKGTSQLLITNTNPEWPPAPPDSPWLVVGTTIAGQVRLSNGDQSTAVIQMGKVVLVLQAN